MTDDYDVFKDIRAMDRAIEQELNRLNFDKTLDRLEGYYAER